MTEQLELELNRLFTEDAEKAPPAKALAEEARRRADRRRRIRLTWGAGWLVAASVIGVAVVSVGVGARPAPDGPASAPPMRSPRLTQAPDSKPTGALPGASGAACKIYTPENVARLAVAFDGTVTAVDESRTDPEDALMRLAPTTFTVHRWYRGGTGDTVTVAIPVGASIDPGPPTFHVGTRLLVSGRGRNEGTPGQNVVAWGCGFTRYYDPATADSWRVATD